MSEKLPFLSEEAQTRWRNVRGWLLPEAANCLHKYARESGSGGRIVEIGSFAGKSTICIGKAIETKGQPMTCIDLRFQPDFLANLAAFGVDRFVSVLEGPSLDHFECWEDPISFLYIDGHHGKGYALADLLLWDMFVVPGGYVALDDTAGFMIGPNLQVQIMTSGGAYEFLEERGGISFLRKRRGLTDLQSHEPGVPEWFARLHVASAILGAMDPELRNPRLPHQPMPVSEWVDRFWHTSPAETTGLLLRKFRGLLKKLTAGKGDSQGNDATGAVKAGVTAWFRRYQRLVPGCGPTLDYLDACEMLRTGNTAACLPMFERLADSTDAGMFVHYNLPVGPVARLRLAQCQDLLGDRERAAGLFKAIDMDGTDELIREAARRWIARPFAIVASGNPLLREYNLAWSKRKIQRI